MSKDKKQKSISEVIPTGLLKYLSISDIKPSQNNPRQLFDPGPLSELKDSIRQHGVLVPITVYRIRGQDKYAILDGERRYRCCFELEEEGLKIDIPANIVESPTKIASLLYMFSIHNFREQWELMPTAISLKTVMETLKEADNKKLSDLTGLSETQVERCKILLSFSEKFQALSLERDPNKRVPSNFWIEAHPVIRIYKDKLPELLKKLGEEALIGMLVEKYKAKKITSVIHFRRIREAAVKSKEQGREKDFVKKLKSYIEDKNLETREAFDDFLPPRNIKTAINACDNLIVKLKELEPQLATEADEGFIKAIKNVQVYIESLLAKIEDNDAPVEDDE